MGELGMAMGMSSMVLGPIITVSVLLPIIIYIVARWRTYRDNLPPDPQVGFKLAMYYFLVSAFQVALLGLWMLVYGIFEKGESGPTMRLAIALLLSGAIIFVAHFMLLQRSNDAQFPMVGRMFYGWCLLVTGVIGFSAFVLAMVMLFQKGDSGEAGKMAWTATFVYCGAWGLQGMRFFQQTQMGRPVVPPPAVPPPAVPPPGGGYPGGYPPQG